MKAVYTLVLFLFFVSCSAPQPEDGVLTESIELGQAWGDIFGSVDEASTAGTGYLAPGGFVSANCPNSEFTPCNGTAAQTRTITDCMVGQSRVSGSTRLSWFNNLAAPIPNCQLTSLNDRIIVDPAFSFLSPRQLTVAVANTGAIAHMLTWTAGSGVNKTFNLTGDGVRKTIANAGGKLLYDIILKISSPVTVIGSGRSGRILTGGTFQMTNNLTFESCNVTPSNLTWVNSSCNCPSTGTLTGSCTNGGTQRSFLITMTGCGTATYSLEGVNQPTLSFDRCAAL